MMATSDRLSATLRRGSDVMYDYYCEPCIEDGQDIEAMGYCQECSTYLCDECLKHHKKNPSSKKHKLLDAVTMPHMVYKDVAIDTDRLVAMATNEKPSIIRDEEDNDAYRAKATENIKSARQEMDKLLDDAEKRELQRVDELHKENAKKINFVSQKWQSVLSKATTMAADLEKKSREGQGNELFVAMTMARRRIPVMEDKINQIKARKISQYKFTKDNTVEYFRSTLSAMFSIAVTPDSTGTEARHVFDINVKMEDDRESCGIDGIAALSRDRIVVADTGNNSVKLVDAKLNKVTFRLHLSSPPFDVTNTSQDQVAVGMGEERKIDIFTVTDILTRTKSIAVPGPLFISISYDGDRFFVLTQNPNSVKIVDMTGKVVSTVYMDCKSNPILKLPRYITLGNAFDVVYITDWVMDTVTCMTLRGRVIWIYKHADLKDPAGITMVQGGDVMVCSRHTRAVHLLSRSGQLVRVLLDKQRGLFKLPQAITVFDDMMWISSASLLPKNRDYVSMFQLE